MPYQRDRSSIKDSSFPKARQHTILTPGRATVASPITVRTGPSADEEKGIQTETVGKACVSGIATRAGLIRGCGAAWRVIADLGSVGAIATLLCESSRDKSVALPKKKKDVKN